VFVDSEITKSIVFCFSSTVQVRAFDQPTEQPQLYATIVLIAIAYSWKINVMALGFCVLFGWWRRAGIFGRREARIWVSFCYYIALNNFPHSILILWFLFWNQNLFTLFSFLVGWVKTVKIILRSRAILSHLWSKKGLNQNRYVNKKAPKSIEIRVNFLYLPFLNSFVRLYGR
jgi:hypothetical protein